MSTSAECYYKVKFKIIQDINEAKTNLITFDKLHDEAKIYRLLRFISAIKYEQSSLNNRSNVSMQVKVSIYKLNMQVCKYVLVCKYASVLVRKYVST